ncbi:MAG: hypothetical protein VYC52_08095, partial [Pseudomonadota bacterium]|nr:hypothetical protein [Pseudomonadota bacterium]
DWHVTAGMLLRIRVDVDILQTNFAEIDHKQVRSLISELLKDLLAKASDLLARLPIRLARPVRVVENVRRGCFRSLWCRGGTSCRISPGSFSFSM